VGADVGADVGFAGGGDGLACEQIGRPNACELPLFKLKKTAFFPFAPCWPSVLSKHPFGHVAALNEVFHTRPSCAAAALQVVSSESEVPVGQDLDPVFPNENDGDTGAAAFTGVARVPVIFAAAIALLNSSVLTVPLLSASILSKSSGSVITAVASALLNSSLLMIPLLSASMRPKRPGDAGAPAAGAGAAGAPPAGAGAAGDALPDPAVNEISSIAMSPRKLAHLRMIIPCSCITPVLPAIDERSMSALCHLLPLLAFFCHTMTGAPEGCLNTTFRVPIRGPNMWYWKLSHAPAEKVVETDCNMAVSPPLLNDASMYM